MAVNYYFFSSRREDWTKARACWRVQVKKGQKDISVRDSPMKTTTITSLHKFVQKNMMSENFQPGWSGRHHGLAADANRWLVGKTDAIIDADAVFEWILTDFHALFSCPGQLNRWPCNSLTQSLRHVLISATFERLLRDFRETLERL